MDKARRITMKDVARASGVSSATVSFVLNETSGQSITPATRDRVRAAARSLGYAPHGIARALREGASRVVVLDVGSLRNAPSLDSFIAGMTTELSTAGHVLFVHHGERDALLKVVDAIAPRAVVDIKGPFVDGEPSDVDGGWAHGLGAHTVTQLGYLVDLGHSRLAFAVPAASPIADLVAHRLEHVGRACEHLDVASAVRFDVSDDRELTAQTLSDLVSRGVTAVAAFDDDTALRVLGAMRVLALCAPHDVAVVGFGDIRHSALWSPALTSVHIDAEAYGLRAARIALGKEPGPWPATPSTIVVRESA